MFRDVQKLRCTAVTEQRNSSFMTSLFNSKIRCSSLVMALLQGVVLKYREGRIAVNDEASTQVLYGLDVCLRNGFLVKPSPFRSRVGECVNSVVA